MIRNFYSSLPSGGSRLLAVVSTFVLATSLTTAGLPGRQDLAALDGVWVYVEDLTEGRELAQLGPPMSSTFSLKVEEGAVVLVSGHGGGHKNVRIALDGSTTEVVGDGTSTRYSGAWKDGVFSYQAQWIQAGGALGTLIRREFRVTTDGLVVTSRLGAEASSGSLGLYRHAEDIPMPTPAKATIGDLAWLAGAWVGTRGSTGAISIEERWSPPKGGGMLAISRTVSRDRISAFEYLRVLERDGGLVYVAQPNGGPGTEFVLTSISGKRAVFDNPRHDYPKRIVYELSEEVVLTATVGFMKGGTPGRFEFRREVASGG